MSKPNMYHGYFPLCTDIQERELTHSKLARDSPCGWCGKKSTARFRQYTSEECTEVYVIASCNNHIKDLRKYTEEYMKKFGVPVVVNDWSDVLQDEKKGENNGY